MDRADRKVHSVPGVTGYLDGRTAPDRADLKARSVTREGVRAILVHEVHRHQEAGGRIAVIDVADLREIELVPAVRAVDRDGVPLVDVVDAVSEGIAGSRQLPGEDLATIGRVSDRGRVGDRGGVGWVGAAGGP